LQAAYARVERARAQIERQTAQPIPNLFSQFSVARDNSTGDTIAGIQFGVPLPIFNRNQGNINVACAELRRAIADVERLKLFLRNSLSDSFRVYQRAREQVERYREDILPTARENLELTQEAYRQGEFDFLRILTARRTFFETNLRYVDSLVTLRTTEVQLAGLLLTGALADVPDLGSIGGTGQRDQALEGR
jgi:cobalt-zinc-cadmium efflux system outer membrane protein